METCKPRIVLDGRRGCLYSYLYQNLAESTSPADTDCGVSASKDKAVCVSSIVHNEHIATHQSAAPGAADESERYTDSCKCNSVVS